MDQLLRPLAAIDRWQQRHIVPGFAVAVVRRFTENRAGHLAALLAYYAFFSVFPLLLVLVTVLGFVLDGRPDLRDDLLSTALGQVPVVSSQLTESEGITGSGLGLLIGLGGALWGGQRVVAAVQHGLNEIYDVPQYERPNPLTQRLRSFATLLVLAGGIVAASTVGSLASVFPDLSGTTEVLLIIATIGLNIATVLVLMQLLTSPDVGWRSLVPGAVFGGVGYFALQQLGGYLVDRYLTGSSDVYGTFAVVIGLLSWFHLLGQLTMLAAEINVVSSRRLYPRRLLGDTMSDGDRRAYAGYLAAQVRDPRVRAAPLPDADGRAPTPHDNDERPGERAPTTPDGDERAPTTPDGDERAPTTPDGEGTDEPGSDGGEPSSGQPSTLSSTSSAG
jgi:YihY family inner membrane protein